MTTALPVSPNNGPLAIEDATDRYTVWVQLLSGHRRIVAYYPTETAARRAADRLWSLAGN